MCGITGVISADRRLILDALERMGRAQKHRGPDAQGQSLIRFGDRWLGLGHQRLSILDLSVNANQPMVHPKSGDQLIFNGEIYNFQRLREEFVAAGDEFQSTGDTEVLLHALTRSGPRAIRRLQGMFAFAFYDARARALVLARDSLGIKPLYVFRNQQVIVFASEVHAILASGLVEANIDWQGLGGLLAYGCLQHPHTMIQGVQSFPPAHYQIILADGHLEGETPEPYWTFPEPVTGLDEARVIPELRETMNAAVRDHLKADVPVGVFLSSGLDSTAIATLAAKHSSRLRSFTVGSADQPDFSESAMAAATARELGLDHTDIQLRDSDAESSVSAWLDSLDQPSVDGLNVFLISKFVRQAGITVAISGQGGDELFGGYPSFSDVPRLGRLARTLQMIPRIARPSAVRLLSLRKPIAYRRKLLDIVNGKADVLELYLQRRRSISNEQLSAMGLSPARLGLMPSFQSAEAIHNLELPEDVVCAVSQLESRFYQHNMLLRDSDSNGMSHGLEIRVPLLDQRMLNLMYAVPGSTRLPHGKSDKHLIRAAMGSSLRADILGQSKRGFTLPIWRWMLGSMRPMCEEAIETLKSLRGLRSKGVDAIWQTFLQQPDTPIWSRAFTLVVAGRWLQNLPNQQAG